MTHMVSQVASRSSKCTKWSSLSTQAPKAKSRASTKSTCRRHCTALQTRSELTMNGRARRHSAVSTSRSSSRMGWRRASSAPTNYRNRPGSPSRTTLMRGRACRPLKESRKSRTRAPSTATACRTVSQLPWLVVH
jgi:hypothetical protein